MTLTEFLDRWNDGADTIEVKTSGSTGVPKVMHVEKKRMLASARMTCDYLGLTSADTVHLCMPLDYIAGKMMVVRAIERGMRIIETPPSGHPFRDLKEIPTFSAIVPLQLYNTLQSEEETATMLKVRHILVGGGAIDESLKGMLVVRCWLWVMGYGLLVMGCWLQVVGGTRDSRDSRDSRGLEVLGILEILENLERLECLEHQQSTTHNPQPTTLYSTYGMTETLSHIALSRVCEEDYYTTLPGVTLTQDADGCLIIDCPRVCATPLHTNDIVEFLPSSPHGAQHFRVLGRRDNVICSGGIKLQAEEIERKLKASLNDDFYITKTSDPKFGEIVVLVTEGDTAEAQCVCDRVLAKYEKPRLYVHADTLPRTETGKVKRTLPSDITPNQTELA